MATHDNSKPSPNYHMDYMDVTQHWHPGSEAYAGGDALLTMISRGWQMQRDVYVEKRDFAGMRSVSVYIVVLERDGEQIEMPLLRNPYINRLLRTGDYNQIPRDGVELG